MKKKEVDHSNRNEYLDLLKGLAIICVIANHSFTIGLETVAIKSIEYWGAIIWSQIFKIAVPLFFTISGFLLAEKEVGSRTLYETFLSKQIFKVYLPMLFWSIPYIIIDVYNNGVTLSSIGKFFLGGYSVYYFVTVIIQFYLLLPLLQKIGQNTIGLVFAFGISMSFMAILDYIIDFRTLDLPLVLYAGNFLIWMMFYVLGIWLRKKKFNWGIRKYQKIKVIILISTIVSFCISVIDVHLHSVDNSLITNTGIKNSTFLFSFLAILLLFVITPSSVKGWEVRKLIGRRSFGIYLIHLYILGVLYKLFHSAVIDSSYFITQITLIIATTLLSLFIIQTTRHVCGEFELERTTLILGFI